MGMPETAEDIALWRHHLEDEADAAYLYRVLAEVESNPERREIYRRLAEVEDRHTELWQQVFAERDIELALPRPSWRARLLAWIARRFSPSVLVPLLLREEGQEVMSYLDLYRQGSAGPAGDAARTLAKESAEHAETLGKMAGITGEPWHHTESGGFLRNVVYGFNDGLTANFGLVAGVIGAHASDHIILVTGLAGTLVAMMIESVALVSVASWVTRRQGRAVAASQPGGARVREVIAHTDAGTLRAAMEAMDRGDFEAAGRVLRRPDVEETFAIALVYNPYSAESYHLEILEGTHVCASRDLSSWDGQALWDALRVK